MKREQAQKFIEELEALCPGIRCADLDSYEQILRHGGETHWSVRITTDDRKNYVESRHEGDVRRYITVVRCAMEAVRHEGRNDRDPESA